MSKDNGGPAFPLADPSMINPMSVTEYEQAAHGLSIRDYFAGQALIACRNHSNEKWLAERAYKIADAMLAERAK